MMRVGIGYDVHRLVENRPLVVGGVTIPFEMGLLGHSDADVLLHAVCDALLGAAGLGDIGQHFPDTDPQYKNADSMGLLRKTMQQVADAGYMVGNIDCTIFAESPKLSPYRQTMARNIAHAVDSADDCINVKATTTEGLGYIGRGEGMAAMAVALLTERGKDDDPSV